MTAAHAATSDVVREVELDLAVLARVPRRRAVVRALGAAERVAAAAVAAAPRRRALRGVDVVGELALGDELRLHLGAAADAVLARAAARRAVGGLSLLGGLVVLRQQRVGVHDRAGLEAERALVRHVSSFDRNQ
eukprot:CAMPEP_0174849898 /NCGR_PEP_ID=MMETSP1114-20130205/18043_1 /TAXON_ID=312471 /ORGANISM="Neobodo designis, Strain CCAP 1951/1" /LENGTH=133 /DNA_ID=CAMNT_0016084313 /DNA_START=92 /DNA_END=493 /DNA_ORIENTATION=-